MHSTGQRYGGPKASERVNVTRWWPALAEALVTFAEKSDEEKDLPKSTSRIGRPFGYRKPDLKNAQVTV